MLHRHEDVRKRLKRKALSSWYVSEVSRVRKALVTPVIYKVMTTVTF